MEIFDKIALNVEKGDSANVKQLTKTALSQNIHPEEILNKGLVKGMNVVGEKFKRHEVFVPEVLIATRAMKAGINIIKPSISLESGTKRPKIILGTVKGDLHDIGKKIVGMLLEKERYEVIDIGIDVSKEKFLKTIKKECPKVIGLSALLTSTMGYMREVIESIRKYKSKDDIKIIIGGAPVTQTFADEINADGYAPDGASAAELVKSLINT